MVVANGFCESIKLRGYRSCEWSGLTEVPPLGVEMFFATAKLSIEAAVAYEIEGTDLGLIVAVKAKDNENAFAAIFLDLMFDDSLDECLDQNLWNYLLNQEFHLAKDGDQTIQTRNIRANINMTDGQNSQSPQSKYYTTRIITPGFCL
ncbi:unnamed protein product [Allacma fusca]|uniref:Uncharacterized protein n=1 Tax=Allacma fusca TaxID=39272 RepID=A0A8J2NW56_9HEXA|nr:unnamed protein product [Allacma fusca]